LAVFGEGGPCVERKILELRVEGAFAFSFFLSFLPPSLSLCCFSSSSSRVSCCIFVIVVRASSHLFSCLFSLRDLASRVENVRFDAQLAHLSCTTTRLAPCTTNIHVVLAHACMSESAPRIPNDHTRVDCCFFFLPPTCTLPSMVHGAFFVLFLFPVSSCHVPFFRVLVQGGTVVCIHLLV